MIRIWDIAKCDPIQICRTELCRFCLNVFAAGHDNGLRAYGLIVFNSKHKRTAYALHALHRVCNKYVQPHDLMSESDAHCYEPQGGHISFFNHKTAGQMKEHMDRMRDLG